MTIATANTTDLSKVADLYADGTLRSLAPLAPIFQLKGLPYTLNSHFMFDSMFDTHPPRRRTYKCCRQVGKCVSKKDLHKIRLADGSAMTEELLRPGTVVASFDGIQATSRSILWVGSNGIRPVLQVTTARGASFAVTYNHPILTPLGWVDAGDLQVGWSVYYLTHGSADAEMDRVVALEPVGEMETFDITVDVDHTFILDGSITHNSQNQSGATILTCAARSHLNYAVITPLFEQVKRISTNFIDPLLMDSQVRGFFLGNGCQKSVLVKSFQNRSTIYFTYAFLNANRTRGIPGDVLWEDEYQDFDTNLLPEVEQMVSGSPELGLIIRTGTAKSFSAPIEEAFQDSSMAEWGIRCGCGHWNIAGLAYDLIQMIGKEGPICAKCGRSINPREGQWLHCVESRYNIHAGYHISQPIHPYVFEYPERWAELLANMEKYSHGKFLNECLGESYDSEERLITLHNIRIASQLGNWINNIEQAERWREEHSVCCLSIDWGGGGRETFSSTSFAFLGMRNDNDKIDCLFAGRLSRSLRPEQEAMLFAELFNRVKPSFVAHDYTGAGNIREVTLTFAGIPQSVIIPFSYCFSSAQDVVTWAEGGTGSRASYMIDKSRSLRTMAAMFRHGKIALPEFESLGDLRGDLLTLFEDVQHRMHGSDITLVRKTKNTFDDFAHALNIGCSAIWVHVGMYPSMNDLIRPVTEADMVAIDPKEINLDTWIVNNKEQDL